MITRRSMALTVLTLACGLALPAGAQTAVGSITVASTTSTENSGLFGYILPLFTAATGIEVKVVAVGTGQAVKLAERGDADVLLVHHRPSEDKFVADGFADKRYDVMYNDFVVVGPEADPAGIKGSRDAVAALAAVAAKGAPFASRGDDSGTHKVEQSLWQQAGIDPRQQGGAWYRETGSGMGATLNTASAMGAYALTDRGTWISFKNKAQLAIVVEGDARLFNPYGVMLVSPAKHPHVDERGARAFIDWLIGPAGQKAIAEFRIDGQPAFFPMAKPGQS